MQRLRQMFRFYPDGRTGFGVNLKTNPAVRRPGFLFFAGEGVRDSSGHKRSAVRPPQAGRAGRSPTAARGGRHARKIFKKIRPLSLRDRVVRYTDFMKTIKEANEEHYRPVTQVFLERLLRIHDLIQTESYPNAPFLARHTEVSVATINRDLEYMRSRLGARIEYSRSRGGYYYEEEFHLPTYLISAKEFQVLAAVKNLLECYRTTPIYREACDILNLLSMSTLHSVKVKYGLSRVAVAPTAQAAIDEAVWEKVWSALMSDTVIEFDYVGRWRVGKSRRRVRPYQLLMDQGVCSLWGYDENRVDMRLFVLSRMSNPVLTQETFELPADYDFTPHCGGDHFGAFYEKQKFRFTVEFFGTARPWVRERIWADDQQITECEEENKTVVSFTAAQSIMVKEWILSQGCNARPVEPDFFVKEWKQEIRRMATLIREEEE